MKTLLIVLTLIVTVSVTGLAEMEPDLAVLPADFHGVVFYPDGETPVSKLRVRVWNAETEEVVHRTRTDSDGAFTIPTLPEGEHYVTVGPVRIDVRTLTGRAGVTPQPHGLVIVVPKRAPAATIIVPGAVAATTPLVISP